MEIPKYIDLYRKDYRPFSYKDYNAFYIQEEIRFIKAIIAKYHNNEQGFNI